jgi:hypothetical protein
VAGNRSRPKAGVSPEGGSSHGIIHVECTSPCSLTPLTTAAPRAQVSLTIECPNTSMICRYHVMHKAPRPVPLWPVVKKSALDKTHTTQHCMHVRHLRSESMQRTHVSTEAFGILVNSLNLQELPSACALSVRSSHNTGGAVTVLDWSPYGIPWVYSAC